ncbi:DUF1330 domain-containing protein (plasmid) [Rhizobium leguminosarum]
MPKGYLIAQVTVTDSTAYAEYGKVAGELLKAAGARQILNPNTAIVAEGAPKARTVIFEFDSFDAAKSFWNSAEYQKSIELRRGAADGDFILVEGAP